MKPVAAAGMPLHFIVPGEPTWRRVREYGQRAQHVAALYDGATTHIWHGEALREQIRCGFGMEIVTAFDDLQFHPDAAALASWCLLHVFGGAFHAPDVRLLAALKVPDQSGIAGFNDVSPSAPGWTGINTAILWSRPGRHEWTRAIDMKINVLREASSRPPSDQVILGHALGLAASERGARGEDDQWIGQVQAIPGTAAGTAQAFVAPDGTIVALSESF